MKKLCLLLALFAPCAFAQQGAWVTVGPFPGPVPALTTYQSNALPNWRGWTKPVYDDVNRGLLIYLASPNCCGGVYVNAMFLYNVESNNWKLMFSHTTSAHSTNQLMVGLSRFNNIASASLAIPEEWPADPSLHSYLGIGSCKASDGTRTPLIDASFATTVPTRVTLNIPPPGTDATKVTEFSFPQTGSNTTLSCPTSVQSGVANCGCAWGLLDSDDSPTDGHPYHQMTWDSTRHVFYRAFGSSDAFAGTSGLWSGDGPSAATYKLDTSSGLGVWTQLCGNLTAPCNVPTHQESAMAYIPDTHRVVLTSGLTETATSDTWELDPTNNRWTQICATSVCGNGNLPHTDAPGFVYFPDLHKAVLFGGSVSSGGEPCQTKPTSAACNGQTWLYDSTNTSAPNYGWTQVSTSHIPSANKFPIIDYVPQLHKVVMVDYDPTGSHIWTFDGTDWTDLTAAGQIPVGPELAQFWEKNNIGAWDSNANAFVVMSEPDTGSSLSSGTQQIWKIVFATSTSAPVASFSPGSVTFAGQSVGTTSAPQAVTLTNTGTQALTISNITITGGNSGDFAQSNNCPSSPATLGSSSSCSIKVTFTPSTAASESALLSVSDNALGSPQTVNLIGTPSGSTSDSFSPGSVTFAGQSVGTTSTPQAVTLTNTGTQALTISNITITGANSGNFAQTNTCPISPTTLAASGSCKINVTFTPSAAATESAAVSVSSNAAGSPQAVALQGIGIATGPVGSLSPTTLGFGNQPESTTSAPQTLTMRNTGNAALTINSVTITGTNSADFAQTTNCPISPATLASGTSCTISVTFTPSAAASESAAVSVSSNAAGSPQNVSLNGTGVDNSVISISASPSSASVGAGQSVSYTVTITPSGGPFNNAVTLSCSQLPAMAACSFSPNNVTPGGKPVSSKLTIATTASSMFYIPARGPRGSWPSGTPWLTITALCLLGLWFSVWRGTHGRLIENLAIVIIVFLFAFQTGCADVTSPASRPGTPAGTYTNITVTATGGSQQTSTTVSLVVK